MTSLRILPLSLALCVVMLTGCVTNGGGSSSKSGHLPPIASATKSQNSGTFKVGNPYKVAGQRYTPRESYSYSQSGIASWYGPQFHGKKTANGEVFDMNDLTAAHKTLQIPSIVRVTNLENGRSLIVRVNDRGPFKRGRIIDMSKRAAELLHFKNQGTARVRVQVLEEESRMVAEMAKRGESTHGVEIAMNNPSAVNSMPIRRTPFVELANANAAPAPALSAPQDISVATSIEVSSIPAPVASTPLAAPVSAPITSSTASYAAQPLAQPSPALVNQAVQQFAVVPTNIYVQAGSFSKHANALRHAESLSHIGKVDVYPAMVNGQQYFRVRFGPMSNVAQADTALASLADFGNSDAIIIVD